MSIRKQFPDIDQELTSLQSQINELNVIPGYIGTKFPDNAEIGTFCYRTDQNKFYQFDGTNWNEILLCKSNIDLGIIS